MQNFIFASAITDFFSKYGTLLLMAGAVGVMFIFMFRTQKKQEKQANDMRNNLQIGDEITTIGGIIGEVVRVKDETVTIETGKDRTKIRILRSAIRSVDVHAADKYGTPAPVEQVTETEEPKKFKLFRKKADAKVETEAAPVESQDSQDK